MNDKIFANVLHTLNDLFSYMKQYRYIPVIIINIGNMDYFDMILLLFTILVLTAFKTVESAAAQDCITFFILRFGKYSVIFHQ